ncbi:ParA family protein [Salmonella enterica]|nr:ParA family protein [Salmonella enterica]EKT1325923.1 ParA family protein [Salmonella enterica]EKT1359042.1 ParA family protein [Salmonella enterica]EKT2634829.1 ParA family protein [Salmonella enterica]EKT3224066.1 ParA family protein [Salmonella enterica]
MLISFISQKGGVGRSTLARATAVELARSGKKVHLADLDSQQQTSAKWAERRDNAGIFPAVETGVYRRHDVALKAASNYQCLIVDTRPFVDISSLDIARQSNLVVIATGTSLDDLEPSLLLGHELAHKGIPHNRIFFVVGKAPSQAEGRSAIQTISAWQFACASGFIMFKPGYSIALDAGHSITETPWKTLNRRARNVIHDICARAEASA